MQHSDIKKALGFIVVICALLLLGSSVSAEPQASREGEASPDPKVEAAGSTAAAPAAGATACVAEDAALDLQSLFQPSDALPVPLLGAIAPPGFTCDPTCNGRSCSSSSQCSNGSCPKGICFRDECECVF